MDVLMDIGKVLICLLSVIIIILVLKQKPKEGVSGAALGQSSGSSYSDRIKGKSKEARLMFFTKVAAGVFVFLTIAMMVIQALAPKS